MDDNEETVLTPNAKNLYRTILLSLCSNFNYYMDPEGDIDCKFRTELQYDMMKIRNETIRVTTIEKMPFSGTTTDSDGNRIGTGIAFTLFHEMQEKLGFQYEIISPDVDEIGNSTHGVIKLLHNNEVDVAVVLIPMIKEYRKWLTFSQTLGEFDWVLLMKRPLASATGSGLLAPFEFNVWFAILAALVIVGPIIYGLVYLRVKLCKDDREVNRYFPLSWCMWFVYGALMKQGSTLSPVSDSARILFATWWIFVTILTSFYTANLTAFLTLSQFTLTIKGPAEIESFRKYWIADRVDQTYEMINNARELAGLKAMIPQYGSFVPNGHNVFQTVLKDYIFVSERRKATLMILQDYLTKTRANVTEADRCTFVLTRTFISKPVAFGYPKEGNLSRLLNPLLGSFVQGGIVDFLMNKPLPMTTICPLNLPSSERKLRSADLIMTYSLVGAGFGLAILAFFIELIYRRFKSTQLSINSGDIKSNFLGHQVKSMDKGMFKENLKVGGDYFYDRNQGNVNSPYRNNDEKKPSTFLFQYTN